jgi:ABC-type branched-subunit amino acid transport system ATPase component
VASQPSGQNGAPMIGIENLSVRFGGVRPLDDLSADLTASIVGLIGPNGAGKTTLLNVLSGFVRPLTGHITMNGLGSTGCPRHGASRWGCAAFFSRRWWSMS